MPPARYPHRSKARGADGRERDMDRVYWLLVILGPLTLPAIRASTNWTTHRANQALARLTRAGCATLTERGRHRTIHANGGNACGLWAAIIERPIASNTVDAIIVTAKTVRVVMSSEKAQSGARLTKNMRRAAAAAAGPRARRWGLRGGK